MESDDDSQYPRYGYYGNPRRAIGAVCQWCGKEVVTWQLSNLTCSHRCHAALYLDTYKHMRKVGVLIPLLTIALPILNAMGAFIEPLVAILLLIVLLSMNGFWVYTFWMVHVGSIMKEKSITNTGHL